MKTLNVVSLVAVAGLAASASAGVLTNTSFEASDGYTVGNVVGQNGWVEFGNVPGSSNPTKFAVVNNAANAFSGSQYVEGNTSNWGADNSSGVTYRFAWIDQTVTAGDLATNPIVHSSVAVRLNTQTGSHQNIAGYGVFTASGSVEALEMEVRTATNQLVIFDEAGNGIGFPTASGPGGTWLNQYLVMDTFLNYSTGLVSFSVNGTSLDAALDGAGFDRSFTTSNIFSDTDLLGARTTNGGAGTSGGAVMRFDNYLVELIPAPSSVALLGLGGLVAVRRRRA